VRQYGRPASPFRITFSLLSILLTRCAIAEDFRVTPSEITLNRNFEQAQLLVTALGSGPAADERSEDLTGRASYSSSDAGVVTVSTSGRVMAAGNGAATVTVTSDGVSKQLAVRVTGIVERPVIGFTDQVIPVLSKAGCNAGQCHATQHGKGGFKLSVFGFEPENDHQQIVRDWMQRRLNFSDPQESLFLKKPTLAVPHGGGRRMQVGSLDYRVLSAWIACGSPPPKPDAPQVAKISVEPNRRVGEVGFKQQLRVSATYRDGSTRDITPWAKFDSMDDGIAAVTSEGVVTAVGRGQAPVMVRFDGQADIAMVVVPNAAAVDLADWKSNNVVDELAVAKFQELGIPPSPLSDDATFLRRAYLDSIGTLPTVQEAAAFLDSTDPHKRRSLIDRLLGLTGDPGQDIYNDRYAAYWTLRWADLLRNSSANLGDQGMWALYNWMRESFRTNKPFDQFVRELITAKGSIFSHGPANYYRVFNNPSDLAEATSQLFLGVRLTCAKCHHHPFEKYGQSDYYSFAAFFSRVGTKGSQEFGLFGGDTVVVVRSSGEVGDPKTGAVMKPTPLDGTTADDPLDRRIPLAQWLTSADNELFARNVVNRYAAYLLGRGLVEPVDDMRATNPPSNAPLLQALSQEFRSGGFNLRLLIRTIMNSRLYQLDSLPLAANATDSRFYSYYKVKRIAAEPLLDAIDYATGSKTKFPNLPLGTSAIELPDANYQNHFLTTFGKPKRVSVCECERVPDENLAQTLHTLNGDILAAKLADGNGRIAQLVAANKSHDEVVTELYLSSLSRRPELAELEASRKFLSEAPGPHEFYQDLLWALINSKQFMFVR
jgi:hypothetical protein